MFIPVRCTDSKTGPSPGPVLAPPRATSTPNQDEMTSLSIAAIAASDEEEVRSNITATATSAMPATNGTSQARRR
ncbi:hypothetical protein [Catellatospora sp. NPDC049609]|uniref:hypothetical protein n=1 Tax=Catellatospora sp. NPDC049609 TaxID=3155505 RepID=UPI003427C95B